MLDRLKRWLRFADEFGQDFSWINCVRSRSSARMGQCLCCLCIPVCLCLIFRAWGCLSLSTSSSDSAVGIPRGYFLAYSCTRFSCCALPRATQGGVAERARNVRNFQAPESKFQISECMQVMRACTSYDKCSLKFQAPAEISGAHRWDFGPRKKKLKTLLRRYFRNFHHGGSIWNALRERPPTRRATRAAVCDTLDQGVTNRTPS